MFAWFRITRWPVILETRASQSRTTPKIRVRMIAYSVTRMFPTSIAMPSRWAMTSSSSPSMNRIAMGTPIHFRMRIIATLLRKWLAMLKARITKAMPWAPRTSQASPSRLLVIGVAKPSANAQAMGSSSTCIACTFRRRSSNVPALGSSRKILIRLMM